MMRIGHGYDVHRLVRGRRLILGGVDIPHETGLLGHSDADVLTHAVMDALLGAAAMGDIGQLFPDKDPRICRRGQSGAAVRGGGAPARRRVYGRQSWTARCSPRRRSSRRTSRRCAAIWRNAWMWTLIASASRRRPRRASALPARARASRAHAVVLLKNRCKRRRCSRIEWCITMWEGAHDAALLSDPVPVADLCTAVIAGARARGHHRHRTQSAAKRLKNRMHVLRQTVGIPSGSRAGCSCDRRSDPAGKDVSPAGRRHLPGGDGMIYLDSAATSLLKPPSVGTRSVRRPYAQWRAPAAADTALPCARPTRSLPVGRRPRRSFTSRSRSALCLP